MNVMFRRQTAELAGGKHQMRCSPTGQPKGLLSVSKKVRLQMLTAQMQVKNTCRASSLSIKLAASKHAAASALRMASITCWLAHQEFHGKSMPSRNRLLSMEGQHKPASRQVEAVVACLRRRAAPLAGPASGQQQMMYSPSGQARGHISKGTRVCRVQISILAWQSIMGCMLFLPVVQHLCLIAAASNRPAMQVVLCHNMPHLYPHSL